MVRFTEPLGAQYGVRAICGKGGFPDEAIEPMQRLGMVYFAIVGGAAALETTQIEEIEEVAWEELMPECLWKFRVKDFGPLTVGIDAHGNSLYHDVQAAAQKRSWRRSLPGSNGFHDGFLDLPARPGKPRAEGLTHVIDKGLGPRDSRGRPRHRAATTSTSSSSAGAPRYVTNNLEKKIALYRSLRARRSCSAARFFEAVYARDRIDEYKSWLVEHRLRRTSRSPTARSTSRASASSS